MIKNNSSKQIDLKMFEAALVQRTAWRTENHLPRWLVQVGEQSLHEANLKTVFVELTLVLLLCETMIHFCEFESFQNQNVSSASRVTHHKL